MTGANLDANRRRLLENGVEMPDPSAVYIEDSVLVGRGTLLLPGTLLRGNTVIGENCQIGPHTMLTNCTVGSGVTINASQCEGSEIHAGCSVGPYAHIRPGCVVGEESHIGTFVQIKNCNLGRGTKMAHLTYVGDADVGEGCNFGCGVVTCNYDGREKHRTTVGSGVFLGCNANLVAPVTVEDGAYIAAGSTITKDVHADALAVARARQTELPDWAARRREQGKLK